MSIFEEEDRRRAEAKRHEEHARTVVCPTLTCNAAIGASCVTPGGRKRHYHTGRVLAVWRAERAAETAKVTP